MSETRIALVTGANQGVGFQVAKALAGHRPNSFSPDRKVAGSS
jgi:NAD(P)-dependent dehydrogenase (short-subunit alcohol dehydrogenase family)